MLQELYVFKEDGKIFANNLKKILKEKNITQMELADMLEGYDYESVKKWLTGYPLPTVEALKELSKVLNMTIEDIFLPLANFKINDNNEYCTSAFSSTQNVLCIYNAFFYESIDMYEDEDDGEVYQVSEDYLENLDLTERYEFKRMINYLIQKDLFSFLTSKEKKILKYCIENLYLFNFDGDGFIKYSYEEAFSILKESLEKKYEKKYKYSITIDQMKEYMFELRKKIRFAFNDIIQQDELPLFIESDKLKNMDKLNLFLEQFDFLTLDKLLSCLYCEKKKYKSQIEIFEKHGARKLNIKIFGNNLKEKFDDISEKVNLIDYQKYCEIRR